MFSGVVKGVEQIPNKCNFLPVTDALWKRRSSVRHWVFFLGNLSSLCISLAHIKAKWSHSRSFLCISHCAQNTRSRVTRNNFWKGKFQNFKDLYSHFSLDITPPNQHWPHNTVIFCETNLLVALPTHKAMSIIWSLGDGDKSDRIPPQIVPSHEDESQYNSCGKDRNVKDTSRAMKVKRHIQLWGQNKAKLPGEWVLGKGRTWKWSPHKTTKAHQSEKGATQKQEGRKVLATQAEQESSADMQISIENHLSTNINWGKLLVGFWQYLRYWGKS